MDNSLNSRIVSLTTELAFLRTDAKYKDIFATIDECIHCLDVIANYENVETNILINTSAEDFSYELNFDGNSYKILQYNGFGDEQNIFIPTKYNGLPITQIGAEAFKNCQYIHTVHLGENIRVIGSSAFEGCSCLRSVANTEGVRFVGEKAFFECKALEHISFSQSLSFIGEKAFSCSGIMDFDVPSSISYLPRGVFSKCAVLQVVQLHRPLSLIGKECFEGCSQLQHISIPATVQRIGDQAFCNCLSLKRLNVESMKMTIGSNVFSEARIWRPDLRYNPRIIYSTLKDFTIFCLPGSTIQAYCRDAKLQCGRLESYISQGENTVQELNMYQWTCLMVSGTERDRQPSQILIKDYFSKCDIVVEEVPQHQYIGDPVYSFIWILHLDCNGLFKEAILNYKGKCGGRETRIFNLGNICGL